MLWRLFFTVCIHDACGVWVLRNALWSLGFTGYTNDANGVWFPLNAFNDAYGICFFNRPLWRPLRWRHVAFTSYCLSTINLRS
ncbi:hypothetical protein BKA67DRAFT_578011 [Truncatella angustata]|uniref:Secreted protein n=1 Tax=Truncatella angustata TaxID=152316 RepID=A0A9P8UCL3_9PEZI|nr:uncharacterized protein BKA67DRAFT_578011 [Truncatella angustata]KAH6647599.1 hypothetical protein BKA67DRAFT_578011 [Truncatella angustata]